MQKELELLTSILLKLEINLDKNLINDLKEINNKLWHIKDDIRFKDYNNEFDNEFVQLATSVYRENDKRAKIKILINQRYN